MATIALTGIDLNDPTPGTRRELATNRGPSGGAVRSRDCVILCNKNAAVGTTSVDGYGDALNTPIAVSGTDEVIGRFGRNSEALLLANTFWKHNGTTTTLFIDACPLGAGSAATKTVTFATNADRVGVIGISSHGDYFEVPVASGDTPTVVCARVSAAINAKEDWLFSCSPSVGALTVNASMVGGRYDHYVTKLRIAFKTTNAMTITHGSTTTGGADDDQTLAIAALENYPVYYQVNPKSTVAAVTSTDNGIGEHAAAIADWISPSKGLACVLITGQVGTPTQAGTVAASLNVFNAFHVLAEGNDYSTGMLAAAFAGVLARAEASDRAPNLIDYGKKSSSDRLFVPDPYAKTDRITPTEIKTVLGTGVTPIAFTPSGKPYIVWHVTTKHLTNSLTDYRARPGHVASIMFDFWESVNSDYQSVAQPKYTSDPLPGQKPLTGFTYPKDIKSIVAATIKRKIEGQPATLDPAQYSDMVESIIVEDNGAGLSFRVDLKGVRHLAKFHGLILETSPSI